MAQRTERLCRKIPAHSVSKAWHWAQTLTESRYITCAREGKSPSVTLTSYFQSAHKENVGWTKPTWTYLECVCVCVFYLFFLNFFCFVLFCFFSSRAVWKNVLVSSDLRSYVYPGSRALPLIEFGLPVFFPVERLIVFIFIFQLAESWCRDQACFCALLLFLLFALLRAHQKTFIPLQSTSMSHSLSLKTDRLLAKRPWT